MKIRHKVNPNWVRPAEPITPAYQHEIDRSIDRLTRDYRNAEKRLTHAEKRLAKAQRRPRSNDLAVALELVELRRQELEQLHHILNQSPAGSQNRGAKGHRGVPSPKLPI